MVTPALSLNFYRQIAHILTPQESLAKQVVELQQFLRTILNVNNSHPFILTVLS